MSGDASLEMKGRVRRVLRAMLGCCVLLSYAACSSGSAGADTARAATAAADNTTDSIAAPTAGAQPAATSATRTGGGPPVVLFIGTSLTAGLGLDPSQAYPQRVEELAAAAGTPVRAINAGLSGETSAGALRRADWVLGRTPADVVVLETGANDGLRAFDPATIRE